MQSPLGTGTVKKKALLPPFSTETTQLTLRAFTFYCDRGIADGRANSRALFLGRESVSFGFGACLSEKEMSVAMAAEGLFIEVKLLSLSHRKVG